MHVEANSRKLSRTRVRFSPPPIKQKAEAEKLKAKKLRRKDEVKLLFRLFFLTDA